MALRARITAVIALVGMSGLSLGAAVALSLACCSAVCENCPVSFCKVSTADTARKVVSTEVAPPPAPVFVRIVTRASVPLWTPPGARSYSSGFVRPMRN